MKHLVILIFGIGLLSLIGWRFLGVLETQQDNLTTLDTIVAEKNSSPPREGSIISTEDVLPDTSVKAPEQKLAEDTAIIRDVEVRHAVPFISQAPHGQWNVAMFQDACEEASILMAYAWTQGQSKLIPSEVESDIRRMTD